MAGARRGPPTGLVHAAILTLAALAGWLAPRPAEPAPSAWRGPFPVHAAGDGTEPTTRVNEPIDLEAMAGALRGDPYDVSATATFTAPDGATYVVGAFYDGGRDGASVYRFRFTPPSPGTWTYRTVSEHDDLDGLTGSVRADPAASTGALVALGGAFAVTSASGALIPTPYLVASGPGGPLSDLGSLPRDEEALASVLASRVDAAAALGFDAVHVAVYHQWFDLGTPRSDRHASVQPDPRTFRVLETLAHLAHDRGLSLHLWQWGDESRRYSPRGILADPNVPGDEGGAMGAASDRLLRYLAARLGPIPNWTASYGFDLNEWATLEEVAAWASRLRELSPVPHLLTATEEGAGRRAFDLGEQKLDVVSRDVDEDRLLEGFPTLQLEVARAGGRPLLLESDIAVGQGPWTEEAVVRTLWRLALSGGVGAVVGFPEQGFSLPARVTTLTAFLRGRLPAGGRPTRAEGGELVLFAEDGGLLYAEDAIAIDPPAAWAGMPHVAVDALAPYTEVALRDAGDGSLIAPHRSDWALAFGSAVARLGPSAVTAAGDGLPAHAAAQLAPPTTAGR